MNTGIVRRDIDFSFEDVPRDWCRDDAYETTFMNALSLLFPDGERFFVEAVKQHRHLVASPELLEQVAGFIGQEAMHGREHAAFNRMLVGHGYTRAPLIEKRVRLFLSRVSRVLSPKSQLAVTCALEHFTAMLAESMLSDARVRNGIDPSILPLWTWHALEESEHKAVAFDVYNAAGGGYARRAGLMLVTTGFFITVHAIVHMHLMSTRGVLAKPWTWLRPLTRLWVYPGHFTRMLPAYLAYFAPSFHPNDRDTRALVDTWRDRLFGAHGELRSAA